MSREQRLAQADATRLPFADASVDLVFGSPPYMDARTYGIGAQRNCEDWIEFMLKVVAESCRVSSGLVLMNCAGVTRDRCYWPGCEGLLYRWWKQGGQCWRPVYWNRVGIPGSGGKQWLRADIEYVLCFKRDAEWLAWSDNTANGHPPKWGPGGAMSHRIGDGRRVNQWVHSFDSGGTGGDIDDVSCQAPRPSHVLFKKRHTKSRPDGSDEVQTYTPPTLANPGNMIQIKVGGGLLGSKLAHENEAPFPEALAEWFIKGWCKPGGKVLDPFSGSGTTASVANRLGRIGIGTDLRFNQCELGRRRIIESINKPAKKPRKVREALPQSTLFEIEAA
jgi:hypothetical protein